MSGKKSTISTTDPALGALQVQTSMYGLAVPRVWGRPRITGNLLWYGDFKAVAHTEVSESGGKAGGGGVTQERTSYTYEAAVALALCAGPINGVVSAWKGKERYSGATVSGRIRTVRHRVTVPVGGVVTVPDSGIFRAPVAVRDPSYTDPGYSGSGL